MTIKEESSFLRGVESRLDSLFPEDTKPIKEKDINPLQTTVEEGSADVKNQNIREIKDIKEADGKAEVFSGERQMQDRSSFVSEIEKRFSAIFGDDNKNVSAVTETEKTDNIKVTTQGDKEENKDSDKSLGVLSLPASSALHAPLKNMKSIFLSIKWEINDQILEQLENEVNKLDLLYTGDCIIQGFLRILRFVGRYVRIRGVSSNQDAINLLLSVYDHLEKVMISEGMTEAKKYIFLIDSIKQYRSWVENTDLNDQIETQAPEADVQDVLIPIQPTPIADMPSLREKNVERTIAAMKDLPPHEAFAYALDEMKKTFQVELDAIKKEIRILKNAK
ncbi:MAG: hypothetical protein FD159_1795 [Syntrophaceae bacterium]|nr:MAG: hypothetical protein FD159_1795 [Syntrophaceae bacterium]